jgi:hypothetical protein
MNKWLKKMAVCILSGLFLTSYSLPASAQQVTLDDLLKRVEAVEKKNADLQQENASLKAEIEKIKNSQAAVSPVAVSAVSVPAVAGTGEIPVTSKLKLSVYGLVQVENVYSTAGAPSGGTTAFSNIVEYAASHVTNSKPQHDDRTSAQNSRLGIDITGPDVGEGKTSGKVEIDFSNPVAASNATTYQPRLRLAYASLDYKKWGITAGQNWDFFAPLKTDLINSSANLWRSGDIGVRHPQAYLTNRWGDVPGGKLISQVGIIDNDGIYLETSGAPVAAVHTSYLTNIAGKDVTIGGGGIYGTNSTSTLNSQGHNNNDLYAGVADVQIKIAKWFSLKGQGFMGAGLTNFMVGPYAQSVVGVTDPANLANSKPLKSMGGFAEFTFKPLDRLQFNVGAGIDDTTNRDSVIASAADQALMWSTNRSYFTNVKYNLTKDLVVAVEYQYLHTNYLDGVIASDNRVDTALIYNF